jgi:hypothetical protein
MSVYRQQYGYLVWEGINNNPGYLEITRINMTVKVEETLYPKATSLSLERISRLIQRYSN